MELRISILKNTILFISNNVSLPFLYKVNFYLNDSRWGSINYLSTIKKVEIIILIFVLFLYDNKIKKETYLGQILINITVSYLIIYLIAWDIKVFTERLSVLFVCFYWFLLADLFEILKNEKKYFLNMLILLYAFISLYKQYYIYESELRKETVRYQNILFDYDNYDEKLLKLENANK